MCQNIILYGGIKTHVIYNIQFRMVLSFVVAIQELITETELHIIITII